MHHREYWVDYAKAIGIILVVYGHVARGIYNAGIEIPFELYLLADSVVYSFHMPLFFFLSGLFFYNSLLKKGGVGLIGSKIDVIVYPYIIWSIAQGVIEAFLSAYTNGEVAYSEVFTLLWSPRAQFWFLYALFIIFCVAMVIFSIFSKKMAIVVFGLSIILYLYPTILPDYLVFRFISDNIVYFVLGIIFSIYFSSAKLSKPIIVGFFFTGFIIFQFIFHDFLSLTYLDRGVVSLLLACISIFFVVSLSSWVALKPNNFFIFIGTSSMAIYLMHILAGSGVRVVLDTVMGVDSFVIHLIFGCFMGLFLPMLALMIINKLNISYLFSAPISNLTRSLYHKLFQR